MSAPDRATVKSDKIRTSNLSQRLQVANLRCANASESAHSYLQPLCSAFFLFVLLLVCGCNKHNGTEGPPGNARGAGGPMPVVAGVVEKKDVPIFLDGLGTVQAFNTVTVRSRVDGQVQNLGFTDGQDVRAGDLLVQLDPAPFQAQVSQAQGKKAQDEAQLTVAKITLARDLELLNSKILSQQEYDTQKAQVQQLDAAVQSDQAAIESAQVQLAYTKITSPIEGRTGIRMVDIGNIVRANDTTGVVVITQLKPISVLFTLPEFTLRQIQEQLTTGEKLETYVMDRSNNVVISKGELSVIDNQIDTSTGTIRLKASFANEDLKLWPGQFVNVRLRVDILKDGIVVPASVVQRGPDGTFAFVIDGDLKAEIRPIKVSQIQQNQALIAEGLNPGERVVVDGQYKLQSGSKVKLPEGGTNTTSATSAREHQKGQKKGGGAGKGPS
jgi:multidrug efflux system membrane fusion protein